MLLEVEDLEVAQPGSKRHWCGVHWSKRVCLLCPTRLVLVKIRRFERTEGRVCVTGEFNGL
ncbi:hypothetical protein BC938DRAFT_477325 [Jimgerdemannia flammicorona]|uniref:Uncharacterized protein n=1 Tax=Jimgerdemannia flammicorona TaxID=994334 RepID=A0A433QPI4_9FUNG|nr:hypothetical protein BC938DRAFT_477325 [Jimgerdemannia flammicorona]